MENIMKQASAFIKRVLFRINKYVFVFIIFFVVTFFIGDSTFLDHYEYNKQIRELEIEIAECKKEEAENRQKLEALKSDNESLERFAREKYRMTKPGEDLFIIK